MNFNVRRFDNGVEIAIRGRMCFSDHAEFRDVLAAFDGEPGEQIVFNLQDLEFIDSSGLGMLIIARDEAKKKQMTLVLENTRSEVRRLMDMARFDRFFTLRN